MLVHQIQDFENEILKKAEKQLTDVEQALTDGGLEGCAQKVSRGKGALNYIFARLLRRYDTLVLEKKELETRRKQASGSDVMEGQDQLSKFLIAQSSIQEFRDELLMTIDDASKSYVTRFLPVLNTVGNVAPLLGLLGTITGMISAFESIAASGTGDPKVVAGGISEALITTAAGLTVAIPSYFFYRYFSGRVTEYVLSMEEQALSLIECIERGNMSSVDHMPAGE